MVLVDTAKRVKEVSDFFGVMEVTYFFQLQHTGMTSLRMLKRRSDLKCSKSLSLVIHVRHAANLL